MTARDTASGGANGSARGSANGSASNRLSKNASGTATAPASVPNVPMMTVPNDASARSPTAGIHDALPPTVSASPVP